MKEMKEIKAWHFLPADRRLRWGTRELVEVGKTLRVDGELVMCERGLHASRRAIDALTYAPGPVVCRVELGGQIIHDTNKSVASERTVLWMADATDTLRRFARLCALGVTHLWDMPEVVRRYLETGDESIRTAARAAARYAAWDTAWDDACAAAGDAAEDAAWAAARYAARAAARDAAWAAVGDPERDAARAAAWDAARDAAREKQNRRLTVMLSALGGRGEG